MALPDALKGDRWTERTARRMFPILVWCAQNGKKITYGQLDAELQRRDWGRHVHALVYRHPAGAIGNALLETEADLGVKIPPLNTLIVNAKTGVPGSGFDYYLSTYLSKKAPRGLTTKQRKVMAEETMKEVWCFDRWDEILEQYGLSALRDDVPSLNQADEVQPPQRGGWSTEPESEAHQQLKKWITFRHIVKKWRPNIRSSFARPKRTGITGKSAIGNALPK